MASSLPVDNAGHRQSTRESNNATMTRKKARASVIYEGSVRHRRNEPSVHQFDFRFFMLMIDLDELDSVFRWQPFWSTGRPALCCLNQNDHLKHHADEKDLRSRVMAELKASGITAPIGPVRLLTQFSYLGFRMNPVSFYYCYDSDGEKIEAIIAEVNNTPWGEQHTYVIPASQVNVSDTVRSESVKKDFHVSPFFDLNMDYRMAFSAPAERLAVKIENHVRDLDSGKRKLIDVTMNLKRRRLTTWSLNGLLVRYPLISFRVAAGIYWQAFKLYWKNVPFVPHPKSKSKSNLETTP